MLGGQVFEGGVFLSTRLPVRERSRTEMRARAVRVLAPTQCALHASLDAIDLFEPGLIKSLGGRNLLSRGRGGRLGLGLRTAIATLAPTGAALPLLAPRRRRRRRERGIRGQRQARLRHMLDTRTGLKRRRHVLTAESDLVKAVGQGPGLVTHKRMDGLPHRSVCCKDLLQGRTSKRLIRGHSQGEGQELVIEALNDQQVDLLQHSQCSCKNGQGFADSTQ